MLVCHEDNSADSLENSDLMYCVKMIKLVILMWTALSAVSGEENRDHISTIFYRKSGESEDES